LSEIRSTIDLIMERTKGMSLSNEERKSLHDEGLLKRAKGLKLKIIQNPANTDEIVSSSEFETEADRKQAEEHLWGMMLDDIPTTEKAFKYIDLLGKLPAGKRHAQVLATMKTDFRRVLKESVTEKKKFLTKEKKKLASIGISGSAVMPRIPKDFDLGYLFAQLIDKYKAKLNA
jgi:hypothetical protein